MPILGTLMGFSLLLGPASFSFGNVVAPQPEPAAPGYAVTLTAYNAVPAQTDANPLETASGMFSNPEVVAARSQNLADKLPFGTIIELDGSNISSGDTCGYSVVAPLIGYRIIADTMNARYTDRLDVLFSTKAEYTTGDGREVNAANVLGVCKGVTFRVVGHVDINDMKDLPKTQSDLAALVSKSSTLALNTVK